MWRIGDLEMDGRVVLAPLSGFTSRAYREFMAPFGAAASVTEMASDMGIIHERDRTEDFISFGPEAVTGVQLFGSVPENLAKAASIALKVNPNIRFFDINMGCPVPKVLRSGSGSLLMKDPVKCGAIVRAVKAAVDVPVTVKMRLGWTMESINFRDVVDETVSAGADAVTIHPRTRSERYAGTPHYDLIEGLGKEIPVPLIVSGNIYTVEDAVSAVESAGAKGVMVARGGVGNPFLVTQIDRRFRTGESLPNPTVSQQVEWCLQLADMLIEEKGDDAAIRKLRAIAPRFIAGCHRSKGYRNLLATEIDSRERLEEILRMIEDRMGSERIFSNGRGRPEDPLGD